MRVPGGAPPAWVWGVRGRALSDPRLPALRAGCRAAVRVCALLGRVGQGGLPGAFWCASPFLWPFLLRSLLVPPPGLPCLWLLLGFFFSCCFSPSPPRCAPVVSCFACFLAPGDLGLSVLSPPPFFFLPSPPSVCPVVCCFACFPAWGALGLGVLLPPPPSFFFVSPPPPQEFLHELQVIFKRVCTEKNIVDVSFNHSSMFQQVLHGCLPLYALQSLCNQTSARVASRIHKCSI